MIKLDTPEPTLNPWETFNRDVVSFTEIARKCRFSIHKAPSARMNNWDEADVDMVQEFFDHFDTAFDQMVQQPKPRVLEVDPQLRTIIPRTELGTTNNWIANAMVRLLEDMEDEMMMSPSSNQAYGFKQKAVDKIDTLFQRWQGLIDVARTSADVDFSDVHPEYDSPGHGNTGVSRANGGTATRQSRTARTSRISRR